MDERVKIISISWGFRTQSIDVIEKVINEAIENGIIIFGAGGNEGSNFDIPFPAIMNNVFCIGSARGKGRPSEFNPPHDVIEKYSVLGEEVIAAYFRESLDGAVHDAKEAKSGSS